MEVVIDKVGVRFGGLWANKDISFKVRKNSITAVIGPNGAGKSTLFNVITGFMVPTEGKVELDGEVISGQPPEQVARQGVARTFQIPEICHDLSVFDNVLVGSHRHITGNILSQVLGIGTSAATEKAAREYVQQLLVDTGLWDLRDAPAQILPLGKVRLLEIARALASKPRLVLLDEAASGLNSQEAAKLADFVRKLPSRGVTVILIEHNVGFVMDLADEVAVLDHGKLIGMGPPESVRQNEAIITAYLGRRKN